MVNTSPQTDTNLDKLGIQNPAGSEYKSEEVTVDEELENAQGTNAKIELLLEKMEILSEEIVPDKLAKFKEGIDEHQRIFEAKIKKTMTDKFDKSAKTVKEAEKKADKLQKAI